MFEFFPSPMNDKKSTVVRNENIYLFGDGRMPTEFFLSLMHDSSIVARDEKNFLPRRIEHR